MKRFPAALAAITLLAFGIRLAFLLSMRETLEPGGYALMEGLDSTSYVRIARNILAGDLTSHAARYSPLYPLVVLPL